MKKCLATLGTLLLTSPVYAESFVDGVTIDTAPVLQVAGTIAVAIGSIWAIKKVVKLLNRS